MDPILPLPILPLPDVLDAEQAGGKAWNLHRLHLAGLPVPPTAVVPVSALRDAARTAGVWERLRADEPGDALGDVVVGMPLPAGWADRWAAVAARLGTRLAVRSSAVGEDGAASSHAGAYHSELGVAPADVAAAVARVWASWWSPSARALRPRGPPRIAVVVQAMLDPDAAGVLFTVNPLNGSWREMVVEAVFGLADELVSGHVAPQGWIVRRPRPSPLQRLWSRVRLEVVQEDLPELSRARHVIGGAIASRPSPGGSALSRSAVLELCRLGLKVERAFGAPQDIEWTLAKGRFVLVQSRPITRSASPHARTDVLWTRRFIGERFPEPPTPLSWSVLQPLFEWFIAYSDTQVRYLGGGPALRLVDGRPYLNTSVFRHLAFKLPGAPPPSFMLELLPPEEEDRWRRSSAIRPDLTVYASILRTTWRERRWERFRWNPLTNHLRWEEFRVRLEGALPLLARTPVSPTDAVRLFEDQERLLREYVGIHLCSLLFANMWYQLLDSALATLAPADAPSWMARLATCPDGNLTLQTNRALWELAQGATDADLAALDAPKGAFADGLRAFLETYGHRSESSWEMFATRWADAPARLLPLLRAQRSLPDPAIKAREMAAAHTRALEEVRGALPAVQRRPVDELVRLTREYLLLRENQRFWFDKLMAAMERTQLWLGGRLVAAGTLEQASDVRFLTWEEVRGLATGGLGGEPAAGWVARRREQREIDLTKDPPVFLVGDQPGSTPPVGGRLTGLGISPGRVQGRVRILRSLADGDKLQPGEILVARGLDPGWTPLLLTAGGAILELGGILSHGAVVAREYGKPAVVNVEGVMRRLRDGQEVTVDGTRGAVWIHP